MGCSVFKGCPWRFTCPRGNGFCFDLLCVSIHERPRYEADATEDHLAPEFTATATKPGRRFLVILGLSAAYVWHLYMADGVWSYLSASGRSILIQRPEKTASSLFLSLPFAHLTDVEP